MSTRLPPPKTGGRGRITLPRTATTIIASVTALFSLGILLSNRIDLAAGLMGFIPARLSGDFTMSPAIPAALTPLTATIVHGGLLHLATNLLVLVWCGRAVERVVGAGPTVVLYLVGAYAAAAAQYVVEPHSLVPMIGASGAISAFVGAFALTYGRPKQLVNAQWLNRALNIVWLLVAWVILQLMVAYLLGQQGLMLATPAHVGGFFAGVALHRPLLLWRYRNA
ncbi:MAG TPA: rhomboid family intramembrane serine protease [Sphingomicrobium sp.]|nr:rhomboid family intramembrane serine protease [Sphingomicrobium sp.]